ncbi:hypothetical protein KO481_12790 [Nocardia sp. NEAU-G5]|uniref:Uncharacterized protein n=1 Tax=Nocardia albiluteola TaxID=2842303 RepID=A0ABS6AWH6_9NOCA|nr:hypothetical protein [Nocardia albiluteola]MBU3062397.1 hypothetical protein [Nocardia albiluteola]
MESTTPFATLAETHSAVVALFGELNRRFAPDVHLGVAHLSDPAGGADEPVLVMRPPLPDTARLSHRLDDPAVAHGALSGLVRQVATWPAAAVLDTTAPPDTAATALRI